ncbi:protein of unknown function [Paenibacillus sp. UNCCL117]|uniref:DUF4386 domain-containing protein n=1 Tax=unclassified Paenibacillus TaxID=185978 RepID=UPI000880DE8B|nr:MULTISPECIES: DUF4386 domain-containing protein [unclassified Paenibacillus]SDE47406.1 protein of unknown function [Paenibacillus sp. cl123]SFW65706.1 protein of unknown function [Paenibacillus sp. UNCCL117]
MNQALQRYAGWLFIAGFILLFIPYTTLVMIFDYPDILRMPADHILTRFRAGGTTLVLVWWAFSLAGLPLIWAAVFLRKILGDEHQNVRVATVFMLLGAVTQIAGLLRWVFVVPVLSEYFAQHPDTSREAVTVLFLAIHQYGGVVLGEHLGQIFSILWTLIICLHVLRFRPVHAAVGWFGIVTSAIYLLGQAELFATVIPGFPVVGWAAPVGSTLWLLWMIALGFSLVRNGRQNRTYSESASLAGA